MFRVPDWAWEYTFKIVLWPGREVRSRSLSIFPASQFLLPSISRMLQQSNLTGLFIHCNHNTCYTYLEEWLFYIPKHMSEGNNKWSQQIILISFHFLGHLLHRQKTSHIWEKPRKGDQESATELWWPYFRKQKFDTCSCWKTWWSPFWLNEQFRRYNWKNKNGVSQDTSIVP